MDSQGLSDIMQPASQTAAQNSFHVIHIDVRDTSSEKISFVFVDITRLVLMFKRASNTHF